MTSPGVCPTCNGPLEGGRCPRCPPSVLSAIVHREIIILVMLSVVAVLAFLGTRAVARLDADIRERDAAAWYRRGQAYLAAGDPNAAAEAFHRASAMEREHEAYRLAHAAALTAADRDDAARQVLLGMRTVSPENSEANLRLARLEARRGDETAAVRYYQNALYGVWREEDAEARARLRVEFIEYLIERGQQGRAVAETVALERNLPADLDAHLETARLFRRAGDVRRALARYEQILEIDPAHAEAAAGAGEAAFTLGYLPRAARHLRAASDDRPDVVELRAVTNFVLSRDPLMPRLPSAERRRRLLLNLEVLAAELHECRAAASRPELDDLAREADEVRAALGRRTAPPPLDTIESGVDLTYRIARALADHCDASGAAHRALLMIGERHQAEAP
jgi:tetratricopeptide (TPR) repeat protein